MWGVDSVWMVFGKPYRNITIIYDVLRHTVGPAPPTSPIQIAFGGKICSGRYAIEGSTITVFYGSRKDSTQLGGSPAISLAKILLRKIVEADPKKF